MKIGIGEMLLILVVALIVLGPDQMPEYAKKLGKAFKSFEGFKIKLSEEINKEIVEPLEEVKKPFKMVTEPLKNLSIDIGRPMEEVKKPIEDMDKPKAKSIVEAEENSSNNEMTVASEDSSEVAS